MRIQPFVFTLFALLLFISEARAISCPELFCGKKLELAASRQLHGYKDINTKQLIKLVDSEQPILILDARLEERDDGRRLGNAKRLPYNTPDSEIEAAINPKDTIVVIYCTNAKCLHSRYLAESMVRIGYTRVYRYPEGLEAWVNAKQPIHTVEIAQN